MERQDFAAMRECWKRRVFHADTAKQRSGPGKLPNTETNSVTALNLSSLALGIL